MTRRFALGSALAGALLLGSAMLPACLLQLDQGVPVELVTRFDAATGTSADEATHCAWTRRG